MRAGGCTVQQALTAEAAGVVKQAVGLARRRGHAQVTPLHVASTMLSSVGGLLRTACLRSHSHPLQCKALELCFNVALNRLPASSTATSPLSGHHHHHHHPPSLSNALVAAFKRAQAHQRRGSVETQQQPLLAVKIELEQLIISILDDPSVSRVMREAGFSSTQVKSNVEHATASVSDIVCNPNNPTSSSSTSTSTAKDVSSVVEFMVSGKRKRSLLVVGESLAHTEVVVRGVMDRVEKGEVPEALNRLQFITLPLFSFRLMSREEVEHKLGELRCLVRSCTAAGGGRAGAVLYLGDLRWAADYRLSNSSSSSPAADQSSSNRRVRGFYCPLEHVIMEIRSLVCSDTINGGRFWLMGIATYQTYMRCKLGNPSLETIWGLQPLAVPAGSLELSLNCDSTDSQSQFRSKHIEDHGGCWSLAEDGVRNQLNCCSDCFDKFEAEARGLANISNKMISSSLPSWLQKYKEESKRATAGSVDQDSLQHLCKKWNSICNSSHKHHHPSEMTLNFYSASPSSSSISSYNHQFSSLRSTHHHPWTQIGSNTRKQWREYQFLVSEPMIDGLNPLHSNPNSTSSSDHTMDQVEHLHKFQELNAENLKILCNALERKVPQQREIIPEIASTILQVRSGMVKRKGSSRSTVGIKEETFLFFLGGDVDSKDKIVRELASLVFGSRTNLVSIGLSTFSSTKSDSSDELRSKRSRSESSHSYLERFVEAIGDNPHRVIVMEDIEQVDSYSHMGIRTAIESGSVTNSRGVEVSMCDAIVVLCCESFDSRSRACSPPCKQKSGSEEAKEDGDENEISSCACLDLNLSVVDEEMEACCSFDDSGLLESVDRALFFKLPEDM